MIERCTRCRRRRPDYIADASCRDGGYCDWKEESMDGWWPMPAWLGELEAVTTEGARIPALDGAGRLRQDLPPWTRMVRSASAAQLTPWQKLETRLRVVAVTCRSESVSRELATLLHRASLGARGDYARLFFPPPPPADAIRTAVRNALGEGSESMAEELIAQDRQRWPEWERGESEDPMALVAASLGLAESSTPKQVALAALRMRAQLDERSVELQRRESTDLSVGNDTAVTAALMRVHDAAKRLFDAMANAGLTDADRLELAADLGMTLYGPEHAAVVALRAASGRQKPRGAT